MQRTSDLAGSRAPACVVLDIIDGRPWKARAIRNNHLRQHCHVLARTFRSDPPTNPGLKPAMRDLLHAIIHRTQLLETTHPSEFQLIPALTRMAVYSGNWLRAPSDWAGATGMPITQLHSLIAHLFERYPMPVFFRNAWLVKGETRYLERDWYCRIAIGGSLRGAPGFPPSITTRALHLAMQAPDHLTIRQALRWGQLKAVGAADHPIREVLASRMVKDLSNDEVWSRLIEKISAARQRRRGDFGLISDALRCFLREEKTAHAQRILALPYRDLVRHCRSFWKQLRDTTLEDGLDWKKWDFHCPHVREALFLHQFSYVEPMLPGKPWSFVEGPRFQETEWRMIELTWRHQLVAEGKAMRHCVGSYWRKCRNLESAIFSLRSYKGCARDDMQRHLTIEVNRQSRRVVKVRGKYNRSFSGVRLREIVQWAEDHQLRYR